jgi:hypothetical protein
VAWNPSGPPQYVDARFCLTTSPPTSLGTLPLGPDVTATQTQIAVNSSVTFSQQFAIVIDTERMNVTAISPGSPAIWTVQRHAGGTAAATHSTTYPGGALKNVMNTPLPLDAAGNQMHMCILAQAVNTVTPDQCTLAAPPTNPPPACLQVDQTILDEGDGWSAEP